MHTLVSALIGEDDAGGGPEGPEIGGLGLGDDLGSGGAASDGQVFRDGPAQRGPLTTTLLAENKPGDIFALGLQAVREKLAATHGDSVLTDHSRRIPSFYFDQVLKPSLPRNIPVHTERELRTMTARDDTSGAQGAAQDSAEQLARPPQGGRLWSRPRWRCGASVRGWICGQSPLRRRTRSTGSRTESAARDRECGQEGPQATQSRPAASASGSSPGARSGSCRRRRRGGISLRASEARRTQGQELARASRGQRRRLGWRFRRPSNSPSDEVLSVEAWTRPESF